MEKIKILMVCLGNICRSPLAEGILKSKLDSNRYLVSSSGTANYHEGSLPDQRSIAVAKKHGIDISNQRASQFVRSDFDYYDYIFVMDMENYKNVIALATKPLHKDKVKLILDEISIEANLEVPDPYYGGDSGFDQVYALLDSACKSIASHI